MNLPNRKRHHLPRDCYQGGDAFFLTICSHGRNKVFTCEPVVDLLYDFLTSQIIESGGPVRAYVLMPDHLHLLIGGVPDVIQWVRWFKSRIALEAKKRGFDGLLWQKGFYDEGVRNPEKLQEIMTYMRNNPVEAGLVSNILEWDFKYGL